VPQANASDGPSQPMIRLDHVSKRYPGAVRPAVEALSLEVARGQVLTLVGPSGCGKTTTLKMINRIIEPSSGSIFVDGQDTARQAPHVLRRSIGYVIQQTGLFPHRTVGENIATVPELIGWERFRVSARVAELAELVGLEQEMLDRYPSELSGGQQQRVGVARALAADPPVLLMDEPFGAVDPILRGRLQDELMSLQAQLHKTIVFVTHDIDEAIRLGDRVAILNLGGVLERHGTPEEVLRAPGSEFVEAFLGEGRGLKRLSLVQVTAVELPAGPVVDRTATVESVREVMEREGVDWVAVLDGHRLLGWVWGKDVGREGGVPVDQVRPFRVTVPVPASLREALDAIVNTRNNIAVVCDGDRYLGMLTLEHLSAELMR